MVRLILRVCVFTLVFSMISSTHSGSFAIAESSPSGIDPVPYRLSQHVKVGIKSILNERVADGIRIGAVVYIHNESNAITVVPELELRVISFEGVSYALAPSSANAMAVQSRETAELSYMITVKRQDSFSLKRLSWVSIDDSTYPAKEREVLSMPIGNLEWKGNGTVFTDPEQMKEWGQSFRLPGRMEPLQYEPVQLLQQNTLQGPATIVKIRVVNEGDRKEWVPEFQLVGRADRKDYVASRMEPEAPAVEPGEPQYIHYALPAGMRWERLSFVTPETFVEKDGTVIPYTVGRLQVTIPETALYPSVQPKSYKLSNPIPLDTSNAKINGNIEISLEGLYRFEQPGDGYQTAVAKFQVTNRGRYAVPVPEFSAEWVTSEGSRYTGSRQNIDKVLIHPGMSQVISYAFQLPASENGERVILSLMSEQDQGGYRLPLASIVTRLPVEGISDMNMYPFELDVHRWSVQTQIKSVNNLSYTYVLKLDLDVIREKDVAIDGNSSRMMLELADSNGRVLGSETIPFTGSGRLFNGEQAIPFDDVLTDDWKQGLSVNIYEVFDTAGGEIMRLVNTLRR